MRCLKSLLMVAGLLSLQEQVFAKDVFGKQANSRDNYACAYHVSESHQLYRRDRGQNDDCSGAETLIKDRVVSLKIPMHPDDTTATAYFVRSAQGRNELWYIDDAKGQPRLLTHLNLAKNAAGYRYSLIGHHKSKSVLLLLTQEGVFEARDTIGTIASIDGAADYRINPNFAKDGEAFSSYLVFVLKQDGTVMKVRGSNPKNAEKETAKYSDLKDYFGKNAIPLN